MRRKPHRGSSRSGDNCIYVGDQLGTVPVLALDAIFRPVLAPGRVGPQIVTVPIWGAQCRNWAKKNIPVPTLGAQCWNWISSAGTGSPVPELGQSLVIATWHPPHIGTGARSGMALRHTLQFMANHYIICPIESQSYAPIGIEFSSLLGQYFDKRAWLILSGPQATVAFFAKPRSQSLIHSRSFSCLNRARSILLAWLHLSYMLWAFRDRY